MVREFLIAINANARTRAPFALAMLDLDHFKTVNDRFGHEAGDQVLVDLAELLRAHSRPEDRLFRFGGEEFVLLLLGVDEARSEEHTSELQSLMRILYDVFCLINKKTTNIN